MEIHLFSSVATLLCISDGFNSKKKTPEDVENDEKDTDQYPDEKLLCYQYRISKYDGIEDENTRQPPRWQLCRCPIFHIGFEANSGISVPLVSCVFI